MQCNCLHSGPGFNAQLEFTALKIIVYININGCGKTTHTHTHTHTRAMCVGSRYKRNNTKNYSIHRHKLQFSKIISLAAAH